jgi:hypothetical protein
MSIFFPLQYPVATPASCETIVEGVRAVLEADLELLLVLQVDMANTLMRLTESGLSKSSGFVFLLCFLLLDSFALTPAFCITRNKMASGRFPSLTLDHARVILWPYSIFALRLSLRAILAAQAAHPNVHVPSFAEDMYTLLAALMLLLQPFIIFPRRLGSLTFGLGDQNV